MLKIKLAPHGKKGDIQYRIVVAEENSKITGRWIDHLGFYRPRTKELVVDESEVKRWISLGAQPTEKIRRLLKIH
ncbi:MAG: 30S ribosomal protein S16 [Candidatus Amesbacteria bacterium GW2011_GWA1_47_16]|uniref:Small ribosomal subunit protein bS16 n=4 Tax=Candidatus Amesiibacteriota TaxID=1752730 RepID=A0A0G1S5N3_9BACT|nr:MAG: 30S ribosomal protein S16 [Candidatus Amesbacteria bacterium GW2011_GWA1_47_16]KKU64656.1 MAG: 30S ribosomal protein S16 [Candidatus Amesbacteria bacterium GW2011_GWC1_47_15]KKU96583.1 MAG: 30S ribosomal protein S16 [Candidatus Amesbacteria bacterium GW2011_GWB1_48_13]OGD00285.1 MAG: 30S ribosomal protein S16 [Candidatus Amesbacteria bacterium RIFCSPHIGHO2_01_FULL_47_34]OGD01718.1 MAG: 30S ribosomal protein S16 [Candidatus Amesbacteria bacterium RIFCSPLOWO2_01_FULL_47_33]